MRKTKTNVDYYEGNETASIEVVSLSAIELQEMINDKEDNEPKDRRSKVHKTWIRDINSLMSEYNERFGKTYTIIK